MAAYVPLCRIGELDVTGVVGSKAYLVVGDEGGEDRFEEERRRVDVALDNVLELWIGRVEDATCHLFLGVGKDEGRDFLAVVKANAEAGAGTRA